MQKIIKNDVQKKQILNIMKRIHQICEENGLYYFLVGGNLIGAIRHKGYIPWDDDFDIMLPRKDYNKLIKIINQRKGRLYAFTYKTSNDYPYAFAKVSDKKTIFNTIDGYKVNGLGIHVDVFPYDGISGFECITDLQYRIMGVLQNFRDIVYTNNSQDINLPFYKSIILKMILRMMTFIATIFSADTTKKVGCVVAVRGKRKEVIEKEKFAGRKLVPFEDTEFYVPVGYDEYLTNLYGNYMKLPPQSERRALHRNEAYWR